LIERLVGKPRHVSVHPGGIVIAEPRIADWVPLERAAKGVVVTQYDMHSLAQLGMVKIDLLGNRALSAIAVADAQRGSGVGRSRRRSGDRRADSLGRYAGLLPDREPRRALDARAAADP
jgi:hypothetical protein